MAEGSSSSLERAKSFFQMGTLKKAAVAGAAGGAYVFVSDWFLDQYFKESDGVTDKENAELMRAGAQAVVGLGLAGLVSRWSPMAAVGIAIGAILGAVRHLAIHWDLKASLEEWFPDVGDDSSSEDRPTSGLSLMGRSSAR